MKKLVSFYSRLLAALLAMLGFTNCDEDDGRVVAYGAPFADYKISGRVVSAENGAPIPGIRISLGFPISIADLPTDYFENRVLRTQTDQDGFFQFYEENGHMDSRMRLWLHDVDGEENGLYQDANQMIYILPSDFSGGKGWYTGLAVKDLGTLRLVPQTPPAADQE